MFAEELVPSLKHEIPANLVAWQLAPLLLSRMVLLDKAAVEHFLPHMLTPKGQWDNPVICFNLHAKNQVEKIVKLTDHTNMPATVWQVLSRMVLLDKAAVVSCLT